MLKRDELTNPASCMSRAREDEMTFVLLGRDVAAPMVIRTWVAERIRLGKNVDGDTQIIEALRCAEIMEADRNQVRHVEELNQPGDIGCICYACVVEREAAR